MPILIPPDWQVPELFGKRLGDTAGRQRAMAAEGHLLLVLHEPPVAGVPDRTCRLFWRKPDGTWKSKSHGEGSQALKRHVSEFADRVDALEKQWQTAASAEDYFFILRVVAPLHRAVRHLHATLQQARELIPEDRDLINLRDRVGEIERALELLHGDAKNGLDFTVAHQAEQQAERTYEMAVAAHRLNLLVATFFPIATLSGIFAAIFGMLVAHEKTHADLHEWITPTLFWFMLALGLVCGLLLGKGIAKKPRPITKPAPKVKPKRR